MERRIQSRSASTGQGDGSIAGVQQLSNQWFALADKDRSKSIGGEEFRELMDTVGLHLRDNEWKLLFEYFDPKKTGEISYRASGNIPLMT
eukprot:s25_g6.t1